MDAATVGYAIGLPPADAVAYLESKGVRVSERWHDLWQEAHARAVTVAGMTRLDLLQDVKQTLTTAVREGKTERWFIDTLEPHLRAAGWTGKRQKINPKTGEVTEVGPELNARLSLIFRQNTQTAFMAGRFRAMFANAGERPWWQYVSVLDSKTRPHHAALNGRVFRYDDVFWKTHYPPNGFRCRCRVRALSDVQLQREGLTPESGEGRMDMQDVVVNPLAPEAEQVTRKKWGYRDPKGEITRWTDVGFSYNSGETWLKDELGQLPEPVQVSPATSWKELGLVDLRKIPAVERLPRPAILPAASSPKEAEQQLADALGFVGEQAALVVATPLGEKVVLRDKLPHMVAKRESNREKFAGYVLPTLQDPFEVWLKQHEDGFFRENYIGLFQDDKNALLVVVRINRDGSILYNIMQSDERRMNKRREGWLIWQK